MVEDDIRDSDELVIDNTAEEVLDVVVIALPKIESPGTLEEVEILVAAEDCEIDSGSTGPGPSDIVKLPVENGLLKVAVLLRDDVLPGI